MQESDDGDDDDDEEEEEEGEEGEEEEEEEEGEGEEEEQFYAESVDERVSDDDDNDNEASGPPIVLQWQGTALLPAIGDHIYSKHVFNVINLFNLSPTKCQLCACVFTCMSAHAKRMRVCVCFV